MLSTALSAMQLQLHEADAECQVPFLFCVCVFHRGGRWLEWGLRWQGLQRSWRVLLYEAEAQRQVPFG